MTIFVCHIGWMTAYEGQIGQPDKIVGGGAYVRKHKDGGETCNFVRCQDGYVYGHVETLKKKIDRPILIEQLGAKPGADYVDHVDVVWTATHPQEKGRRVVGWYRDARVYRERVEFDEWPSPQHKIEPHKDTYRVRAKTADAFMIPPKQRHLRLQRGKGWIGQANWWFPEQSTAAGVKPFVRKVRALIDAGPLTIAANRVGSGGSGRWGGKSDPLRNAEVERAAILAVSEHFSGYTITSVEKENLGWDLEARRKGEKTLRLEVKGLFGNALKVGLTPREYRALNAHMSGGMPNYRLCMVAAALAGKPRLVILRYDPAASSWRDEHAGKALKPKIDLVQGAIVTLP